METITAEEWLAKGKELFGDNMLNWRFVCPGCGHVQTPQDFQPFQEQGATPDSARNECIGRYTGGKSWLRDNLQKYNGPCDYAGYGLFSISPVVVLDGAEKVHSFAFDTVPQQG